MSEHYVLAIDQSTSGTKALLFDKNGDFVCRTDVSHRQLIDERGWVEHDPVEIYDNLLIAVRNVILKSGIDPGSVVCAGISNQRETVVAWDRETGKPIYNAIVWQCGRAKTICSELEAKGVAEKVKRITGLNLSPYFSAAKIAWILRNVPGIHRENVCCGTIDSWVLYRLTNGAVFATDYSNASRTQLFDIHTLKWSEEMCGYFGIDLSMLPAPLPSDTCFGASDFGGLFERPIPIHAVMGDSHGALFGQGCRNVGDVKATYGTGSSVMMNVGETPVLSENGLVSSVGWALDGQVAYVLEGNINYAGAVMKWLADDLGLIDSPKDAGRLSKTANPDDSTYLVPAFSGLGAPYWDRNAKATLCGMTRTTGKAEIVRAANDCVAYQITDIVELMQQASGISVTSLRVDGGPTRDRYLMQFQSDILFKPVEVPEAEELSGIGVAYAAGLAIGLYKKESLFARLRRTSYMPEKCDEWRAEKKAGWAMAVSKVLSDVVDG